MSSYKEFMKRKQAADWSGDENQQQIVAMGAGFTTPWQQVKGLSMDSGEGVYAFPALVTFVRAFFDGQPALRSRYMPLQSETSSHGLTARCDRPRLGLKWPERERLGVQLLPLLHPGLPPMRLASQQCH